MKSSVLSVGVAWALSATSLAAVTNGGFESGNTSAWTVSIPSDWAEFDLGLRPAGTVGILTEWAANANGNPPGSRLPMGGNYFLAVGSAQNACFTNTLPVTYDISVSQTVSLRVGDLLSGWAFFYNGDFEAQDSAWVRILDSASLEIANPWRETSGSNPNVHYHDAGAWTYWQWQATADGVYTVDLGVTTFGDDKYASYGGFDGISLMTPVPEPGAAGLLLLGTALLRFVRSGKRKGPGAL